MSLLQKLLLFFLIFSLPLQKRILLFYLPLKNTFNQWSGAFLYLNDLILIMLIITLIIHFCFSLVKKQNSPLRQSAPLQSLKQKRNSAKKNQDKIKVKRTALLLQGPVPLLKSLSKKISALLLCTGPSNKTPLSLRAPAKCFLNHTQELNSLLSLQLFCLFIFLSLFDHYFWSIQNGALLLWFILALTTALLSCQKTEAGPLKKKHTLSFNVFIKNIFNFISAHNNHNKRIGPLSKIKILIPHKPLQRKIQKSQSRLTCASLGPLKNILRLIGLFALWLSILILLHPRSPLKNFQIYFSLRLISYFLFFILIFHFLKKYKNFILYGFLGTTLFQALTAILQFVQQKSLGLKIFAESPLSPTTLGAAKFFSEGSLLLRAYGLLPHSNILAAYLLVSFIVIFYLLQNSSNYVKKNKQLLLYFLLLCIALIDLIALFFTFSRSAYLVLVLIIFSSLLFYPKLNSPLKKILSALCLFSLLIVSLNYKIIWQRFSFSYQSSQSSLIENKKNILKLSEVKKFIQSQCSASLRAGLKKFSSKQNCSLQNSSCLLLNKAAAVCSRHKIKKKNTQIDLRLQGIKIAFEIIKQHPLTGLGQGLFVFKMQSYTNSKLEAWQVQPVHNLFLLQSAELGLIGFILFNLLVLEIFQPYQHLVRLLRRSLK